MTKIINEYSDKQVATLWSGGKELITLVFNTTIYSSLGGKCTR